MPGPTNTLLIEGSFEELAEELAQYIDGIKKSQGEEASLESEITSLSEQGQKDEVLKKIVTASAILNAAPEKGKNAVGLVEASIDADNFNVQNS